PGRARREQGEHDLSLWLLDVSQTREVDLVSGDLQRVTSREGHLYGDRARLACRDRDGDDDDAEVHDVPAVTATIAAQQIPERDRHALAVHQRPRANAADELLHHR